MLRRFGYVIALSVLCNVLGCGIQADIGSIQQALVDGGAAADAGDGGSDGGTDGGGMLTTPRLKPVQLQHEGVTVGYSPAFYDTKLGVRCTPQRTTEDKIRCLPDVPARGSALSDFGDMEPPGAWWSDSGCAKAISRAFKTVNPAKVIGRYAVVRRRIDLVGTYDSSTYAVDRVLKVSAAAPMLPLVQYHYGIHASPVTPFTLPDCVATTASYTAADMTDYRLFLSDTIPLSEFAELTETH